MDVNELIEDAERTPEEIEIRRNEELEDSQIEDTELFMRGQELFNLTTLSLRESEVLALKEAGQTHSEIAATLEIEKGTVASHAHRGRVKYKIAESTVEKLQSFYEPLIE
jgi:DNA-directed RNA polymerase specialized sigma24 family protein